MKDWAIAAGAWGDVICELGYVQRAENRLNLLYFGWDNSGLMRDFLEAQSFIGEVRTVKPLDKDDFKKTLQLLIYDKTFPTALEHILRDSDLAPGQFHKTVVPYDTNHEWRTDIPIGSNFTLPESVKNWALSIVAELRDFFIVQPFSINTVNAQAHWPYWHELMQWIGADMGNRYVIAGVGWDASRYDEIGSFANMVDRFPSVCHLYALAEHAKGVITTSNSLAHWCVCQQIPAVVIMNAMSSDPNFFFNKAITGPNVNTHSYYSRLSKVAYALREKMGIWPHVVQ